MPFTCTWITTTGPTIESEPVDTYKAACALALDRPGDAEFVTIAKDATVYYRGFICPGNMAAIGEDGLLIQAPKAEPIEWVRW